MPLEWKQIGNRPVWVACNESRDLEDRASHETGGAGEEG